MTVSSSHVISRCSTFSLRNYIRYATLKSGDQIKRCSLGLGNIFSDGGEDDPSESDMLN